MPEKVPLVIEILAKQHRESFCGTSCTFCGMLRAHRSSRKVR